MDKRLSLKLFRIFSILTLLLSFVNIPIFASAKTVPVGDGNLSIDSSKLYVQGSNSSYTEVVDGDTVPIYSTIRLEVLWSVSDTTVINPGDSAIINLPSEYFSFTNSTVNNLKLEDGIVIGTYQITNGKIVIKFGDMISDLQQIKNGYIRITGQVNQERVPGSSYVGDLMLPDIEIPGYVPPVDTDDSLYPITNTEDLNKYGHQGTYQSNLTWQISLNRSSMITAMKTGQVEVKKNAVLVDKFNNGQVVNNVRLFNYVYGMTASNEVAYVGGYQEYSFVAVTQASNDTWQSFYNKIESSPGSYGIYKDDQGTETLMIGFGALPGSITSPLILQDMIDVVNNRNPALSTDELTNSIQGLNNLSKATNQKMFISPNISVATTVPADTPTETITNKVELYYGGAKQT